MTLLSDEIIFDDRTNLIKKMEGVYYVERKEKSDHLQL